MRLIAVGDIHGHSRALRALLEQISPAEGDEFVFLGDYIDRGPDSYGVVEQVLELQQTYPVRCLLGNHEEMAMAATISKSEYKFWCQFGGKQYLQSYGIRYSPGEKLDLDQLPRHHAAFLGSLLDFYETDEFIFVHAAYHPEVAMAHQSGTNLRWVKLPDDLPAHRSGKKVFCGHTPFPAIQDRGHVCCLDTGCGTLRGGCLTAMDVLTGTTWQVPYE